MARTGVASSNDNMYLEQWVERGVSDWEFKRCSWWLDYLLKRVPRSEELLQKGIKLFRSEELQFFKATYYESGEWGYLRSNARDHG